MASGLGRQASTPSTPSTPDYIHSKGWPHLNHLFVNLSCGSDHYSLPPPQFQPYFAWPLESVALQRAHRTQLRHRAEGFQDIPATSLQPSFISTPELAHVRPGGEQVCHPRLKQQVSTLGHYQKLRYVGPAQHMGIGDNPKPVQNL